MIASLIRRKMNKTKLRWKIYNILNRRGVIESRRGGYSIESLYNFVLAKYNLELGLFSNPVLAIKDLTPSLSSFF